MDNMGKVNRIAYTLLENFACETQVLDTSIGNEEIASILSRGYLRLNFGRVFQHFVKVHGEYCTNGPAQLQLKFGSSEITELRLRVRDKIVAIRPTVQVVLQDTANDDSYEIAARRGVDQDVTGVFVLPAYTLKEMRTRNVAL